MGKHRNRNILLGVIGLIVVVAIFGGEGVQTAFLDATKKAQDTSQQFTQSITTPSGEQIYNGNFNLEIQAYDTLDSTITYGGDAELDTIAWDARGTTDETKWKKLSVASSAEKEDMNIKITRHVVNEDGTVMVQGTNVFVLEFNLSSSQYHFIDEIKTVADNERITGCQWGDANDDTDGTWMCTYNAIGITTVSDPTNEPSDVINLYLYDEDVTDDSLVNTSVASVGSVSQGGNQLTTIKTLFDMGAKADVKFVSDLRIRFNHTSADDSVITPDKIRIRFETGNVVNITELNLDADFTKDAGSTNTDYYWKAGSDYKDAIQLYVEKNGDQEITAYIDVYTNFSTATGSVCMEFGAKYIDGFGDKTTSWDSVDVEITSDSIGDECTIS